MANEFYAKKIYCLIEKKKIVIEGISGISQIKVGMKVGISFNRHLEMSESIDSIETINEDQNYLRLIINYDTEDEMELWMALNIGEEYISIT